MSKNVITQEFIKNAMSDDQNLIYEKAMDQAVENIAVGFGDYLRKLDIRLLRGKTTTKELFQNFMNSDT